MSSSSSPASKDASRRSDVFAIGEILGDVYEIKSILGAGGMGQVFEAHDRLLNRRVAIKAQWPDVKGHGVRKEAQALAAIRHPSMITIYALGVHRGVEYVVMERLHGVPLDVQIDRRLRTRVPFTVREVLELLVGIADGLAAVHRGGVAHRDVKPENVMLAPGGRVILMDFGIVMPEFSAAPSETISGSPNYMAPETIRGEVQRGNAFLVDIYALGVIGFELLTGELPYDRGDVRGTLIAHLTMPVPDVSDRRDDVPPKLAKIVADLMSKEPDERPQSMESIAFQLRAIARELEHSKPEIPGFSVMVVDDDKEIAKLLGHWAKKGAPDADVRVFHDAESAIAAMHRQPPSVVLLDLHMPKMNGIEVCMYLRGTNLAERCAIVAVSAGAQEGDLAVLQQLGMTHFVPKDAGLSKRITELTKELREASR
jgi:serine/threonine-protein kinase